MRYLKFFSMVLTITVIFSSISFAQNNKTTYEQIENNLLAGLNSNNFGLTVSSAYYLGEFGSVRSTIPLMKLLHSGTKAEERIVAALSLTKLKSERGIFAVKRAAKFDPSERVRKMCKNFYTYYINQKEGEVSVGNIELASTIKK